MLFHYLVNSEPLKEDHNFNDKPCKPVVHGKTGNRELQIPKHLFVSSGKKF